jgi:hypothetical protein
MQAQEQLPCTELLPLLWAATDVEAAAAGSSSKPVHPPLQRMQQ